MVGRTNVAGARLRSVIAVTYPEGSVCSCTNGTKTLKAKDTSGKALFNVPLGTWTVTARTEDGSKEKSVDVTITSEGQVTTITLSYELFLYNAGKEYTDITGGWTADGYTSSRPIYAGTKSEKYLYFPSLSAYDRLYLLGTDKVIQFSGFTKLVVTVESASNVSNQCIIGESKLNITSDGIAFKVLKNGENTLDISSLNSGFIALYTSDLEASFKVTKVRLK